MWKSNEGKINVDQKLVKLLTWIIINYWQTHQISLQQVAFEVQQIQARLLLFLNNVVILIKQ